MNMTDTSTYTLLDGKALSAILKKEIGLEVAAMVKQGLRAPHLAAILVGEDGASMTYVGSKVKTCDELGFESTLITLKPETTEAELLEEIEAVNNNDSIDGLIVQLPLPKHISVEKITTAIHPRKDVDGFNPVNVGRMVQNLPAYLPATPFGILQMLESHQVPTEGKHCVVIGRSNIVGMPMSVLMARNGYPGNCTVTLCHSRTANLKEEVKRADIVIAALGKPGFVKGDMIKPGAVVIDVGITRVEDATRKAGFRLAGDVDFESVAPLCSYITPVPGGVGPMTIIGLLQNTLKAARHEIYS